jgi:uncharacterized protein involved in exopolysaccharide biosynthesis
VGISYSALTFRDILRIIRRHYRLMFVIVAVCLLVAIIVTLVTRSVYQSDAVIVVKFGREFVYRSEVGEASSQPIPTSASTEELLNTLVQLLQSRDIAVATLSAVGSEKLYPELRLSNGQPDLTKATDRFVRAFSARPLRNSNVVQLSFQHPDPALAETTLTTLIQIFRDRSLTIYANSQTEFFKQQGELAQTRLNRAAERLAEFRTRYGALAYEGGLPLLLQQRSDLAALVSRTDADLAAINERVSNLRKQAAATPAEVVAHVDKEQSRVVDDARSKLLNLRLREQELLVQFADDSPPLKQVRAEIRLAEGFLRQQAAEFAGTVRHARNITLISIEQELARSDADRASLAARTASLRDELVKLDGQVDIISKHDPERWSLERAVDTGRAEVKQITVRLEQSRLLDALNENRIGNIGLIQAPSLPDRREPVRPRWSVNLGLGFVIGLVLSVVIAVLLELRAAFARRSALS